MRFISALRICTTDLWILLVLALCFITYSIVMIKGLNDDSDEAFMLILNAQFSCEGTNAFLKWIAITIVKRLKARFDHFMDQFANLLKTVSGWS